MSEASRLCTHCRLPIPPGIEVLEPADGTELAFCCRGCRGAYRIIHGAGLDRFYRERQWQEPGLPEGAFASDFDAAALERHVRSVPDGAELSFRLEGIHCATCVWLNEKILSGLPGVSEARVNYATHRARVRFDPDRIGPRELFSAVGRLGYRPRPASREAQQRGREREQRRLLTRFGTAAFLSLQLMGFSLALYAGYFKGMSDGARQFLQILAGAVATPVIFYAGAPFLAGAWRGLRNGIPGMDLLVTLGVLAAYGYSLFGLFTGGEVYFDSAAMIVTLLLLGRLLESGARNKAAAGIEGLLDLAPDIATRLDAGRPVQVTSEVLGPGDLILVGPGERLPVDGALAEGRTEIDESVVSGEPLPVLKRPGDRVVAGSLNLSTAITLRVGTTAAESFPARAARLVEEAQTRRAPIQRLADRVAAWFVPAVILLAALTWFYWSRQGGGPGTPLLNAVSVLVVACPCALGLATPTAILVASAAAARRGIFFRGGDVIERVGRLDVIAFDKTGTLTRGRPAVSGVTAAAEENTDEVIATAARVESGSAHPLARGIMAEAARRALHIPLAAGARSVPGLGVSLDTGSGLLLAGRREFLENHGTIVPPVQGEDLTMVHVARGSTYLGVIFLEDPLRDEAEAAIAALDRLGIATALLTGDRPGAGRRVATRLGIDDVPGGLVPEEKAAWVEARRRLGRRVMMVGDGINDAPALAAADVGCAPAGGTDLALDTSELVLTRPDLGRLVEAVRLGRRTLAIVRQNLFWAFCYNLLALPLAASGRLLPIHAAAAMAFSSVCVVANSLRLARNRRLNGFVPSGATPKFDGLRPESVPRESR